MRTAIETQAEIDRKKPTGSDFILVTNPGHIDVFSPLLDISDNSQRDALSEIAFTRLKEKGIWNAIISAADSINSKLKPAVDYGYIEAKWGRIEEVAVIRWAPEISSDDGKISSKAIRAVLPINGTEPKIFYSSEREIDGEMRQVWKDFELKEKELKELPLERKIQLAMLNVSARIEDNRSIRDGQLVGRPGIGNIL
jgi:Ribonuclease G/E